jgi:hypothetical protein
MEEPAHGPLSWQCSIATRERKQSRIENHHGGPANEGLRKGFNVTRFEAACGGGGLGCDTIQPHVCV